MLKIKSATTWTELSEASISMHRWRIKEHEGANARFRESILFSICRSRQQHRVRCSPLPIHRGSQKSINWIKYGWDKHNSGFAAIVVDAYNQKIKKTWNDFRSNKKKKRNSTEIPNTIARVEATSFLPFQTRYTLHLVFRSLPPLAIHHGLWIISIS